MEHASREEFLGDLMVEVHVVHREEKKGEDDDEKKDARKSVDKNVFTRRSRRAQETKHAEKLYAPKNDVARDDSENT